MITLGLIRMDSVITIRIVSNILSGGIASFI